MAFIYKASLTLAVLIALAIIGLIAYEQLHRISAETNYSPEGHILELPNRNLHYLISGSGSPTVILESGLDPYGHLSWFKVEKSLRDQATVISYDRAGILWSDPKERQTSLGSVAEDLEALLATENLPKPYIIVGHSAAGITLRRFILENLEDIAGIVLVDASHPEQTLSRPPKVPPAFIMDLMSSTGLMRMTSSRTMPNTAPADRLNLVGSALIHRSKEGMFAEAAAMVEMAKEAEAISSFGDTPLIVISATAYKGSVGAMSDEARAFNTQRELLQSDLLRLSTRSSQVMAQYSNHYVQLDEPEIVVSAIRSFFTNL